MNNEEKNEMILFLENNIEELKEFIERGEYSKVPTAVQYAVDDQLERFKEELEYYKK